MRDANQAAKQVRMHAERMQRRQHTHIAAESKSAIFLSLSLFQNSGVSLAFPRARLPSPSGGRRRRRRRRRRFIRGLRSLEDVFSARIWVLRGLLLLLFFSVLLFQFSDQDSRGRKGERVSAMLCLRDPVGLGQLVAREQAGGQQLPAGAQVGGTVLRSQGTQGKLAPGKKEEITYIWISPRVYYVY